VGAASLVAIALLAPTVLVAPATPLAGREAALPLTAAVLGARATDATPPPTSPPAPSRSSAASPAASQHVGGAGSAGEPIDAWQPAADARPARLLEAALDAALLAIEAPGASVAVARDAELVWAGAAGTAPDGTPITLETPLVIGSITKTFVAALILQLVEEGRLRLDDPLATYLPELELAGVDVITLRQLLNHTSGLADVFNDTTRVALEVTPDRAWDAGELLAALHEPWYAPGEDYAYANTNYLLLTLVAERVTGFSLEQLLADRLTEPLGLEATRLIGPEGAAPARDEPLSAAWATIFRGSGAMVSTASDLARWGDALYGGSVLLSRTRAEMLDFNGHNYGLGVQRLEVADRDGYGHTGLLDRYTGMVLHLPADEVTVALIIDTDHADLRGLLTHGAADGDSLLELATESGG
jgi:D-alanyl-D-alanine carboxypeptidase